MLLIGLLQKMVKKFLADLYAYDNVLYFNEDSGDVVFHCNEMGILSANFNNINPYEINCDEDDPETVIHIRFLVCHINFIQVFPCNFYKRRN